jgi:hypothetical protein
MKDIYTKNDIIILNLGKYIISDSCRFFEYTKKRKDQEKEMWRIIYYRVKDIDENKRFIFLKKYFNINNLPMCKILIILDQNVIRFYPEELYFGNLPPSLDIIYIPFYICCSLKNIFRLPYGCKIKYYLTYNDIPELQRNMIYRIYKIDY